MFSKFDTSGLVLKKYRQTDQTGAGSSFKILSRIARRWLLSTVPETEL